MPRPTKRRFTLARLALIAWLAFVAVASVGPFLVAGVWSGPKHNWSVSIMGGGVSVSEFDVSALGGGPIPHWRWEPSARYWWNFDADNWLWWSVAFSPWAVFFAPTLLALGIHRYARHRKHRKLTKLGRTPCPTCGYDATDLTTCPECGTTIHPHTETQS